MEASCDAEWISNIDCSVANKVTFTVDPNDQAEERTTPLS
ncbi:BACON domain-containing carbohydrate-binding protein [uncultured Alistipes sp.]|nr:BACON domain-containing carbohydrate-binding protein [uncultured Alistipes sp.]